MSEVRVRRCLFLPCSAGEIWALPTSCLAEIVTLYDVDPLPPEWIKWRGQQVPVLDLDGNQSARWRDSRSGSGMVAVLLGIAGLDCHYLGVALRGAGLGLHEVPENEMEDCPDEIFARSVGAFRWRDTLYQIPDLLALLKEVGQEWRFDEDMEQA